MAGHLSGGRRAGLPPGRPGGKDTTGEELRGAEASGERHAPQRVATLSFELYSFFVFKMFFAFCNCVASSMFPTFPFCVARFWLFGFVQRFLRYQAAQGFQYLEGF